MDNNASNEIEQSFGLVWNVNSFYVRKSYIEKIISETNPSVVFLNETRHKKRDTLKFRGYEIYAKSATLDTDVAAHGGVALMVKDNFSHKQIEIDTNLQAVAVEIYFPFKVSLICIYIPPRSDDDLPTIRELEDLIAQVPKPFMIAGDMNGRHKDFLSLYTNKQGELIRDFIDRNNLVVQNDNKITRPGIISVGAMIDLVLVSADIASIFEVETSEDTHTSDHCYLNITTMRKLYEIRTQNYNFKKADWKKFTENVKLSEIQILDDIDVTNENIVCNIINAANIAIPKFCVKFNSEKCKSWWNEKIHGPEYEKMKMLQKRVRTNKRDPNHNHVALAMHVDEYRKQKEHFEKLRDEAKTAEMERFCQTITEDTSNGVIWKKIRADEGKRSKAKTIFIYDDITDECITDKTLIAEKISECFLENFRNDLVVNISEEIEPILSEEKAVYLNDKFTLREMMRQITRAKNSAPGSDNISYIMIKNLKSNDFQFLLDFYNKTWEFGKSPIEWKKSVAVAIPKDLKQKHNVKKFRPIQLESVLTKIKENMVAYRLNYHMEIHKLSYEMQNGFRAKRSTCDNLIIFEDKIRNAFNQKKEVIAIFFDLQKAFDCIKSAKVIECLREMGIHGHFLDYVKDFFADRKFKVKFEHTFSSEKSQENGVPQGSGLSVQMFKIVMDKMKNYIFSKNVYQFADDFVYLREVLRNEQVQEIENDIEEEMKNIEKWAKDFGLTISSQKTKFMMFTRRTAVRRMPKIKINDVEVEKVSSFRFLGVTFQSNLRFTQQIDETVRRINNDLSVLKCLSSYKFNLSRETMLQVLDAKIRSKIEYASFLFLNESEKNIKKLRVKYNAGLRISLGAFYTTPVVCLYSEAGRMSIENRAWMKAIKYVINVLGNKEHPLRSDIMKKLRFINANFTPVKYKESSLMLACREVNRLNIQNVFAVKPIFNRPTWEKRRIFIDKTMQIHKKDTVNAETWKKIFAEKSEKYKNTETFYTDGTKLDDKVAFAVVKREQVIVSQRINDNSSVMSAEAFAVVEAAKSCVSEEVVIMTDSLSTVDTIESLNAKNNNCRLLVNELNSVKKKIILMWIPSHQGIVGNEFADEKAKLAVNGDENNLITENDAKMYVKKVYETKEDEKWRDISMTRILRKLKDDAKVFIFPKNLTRKDQVKITRLRLGKIKFLEEYLFHKGLVWRGCEECEVELTVEHMFTVCTKVEEARNKFNITLDDLKNTQRFDDIIKFMKEISMYEEI